VPWGKERSASRCAVRSAHALYRRDGDSPRASVPVAPPVDEPPRVNRGSAMPAWRQCSTGRRTGGSRWRRVGVRTVAAAGLSRAARSPPQSRTAGPLATPLEAHNGGARAMPAARPAPAPRPTAPPQRAPCLHVAGGLPRGRQRSHPTGMIPDSAAIYVAVNHRDLSQAGPSLPCRLHPLNQGGQRARVRRVRQSPARATARAPV